MAGVPVRIELVPKDEFENELESVGLDPSVIKMTLTPVEGGGVVRVDGDGWAVGEGGVGLVADVELTIAGVYDAEVDWGEDLEVG